MEIQVGRDLICKAYNAICDGCLETAKNTLNFILKASREPTKEPVLPLRRSLMDLGKPKN
jgi:hypothetical protein